MEGLILMAMEKHKKCKRVYDRKYKKTKGNMHLKLIRVEKWLKKRLYLNQVIGSGYIYIK
jgi:hypothetical protein